MVTGGAGGTPHYELPLPGHPLVESPSPSGRGGSLPESVLVANILWFCRFRWLVIALFIVVGVLSRFPALLDRFGLHLSTKWPFSVAVILTAANLAFLAHARALRDPGHVRAVTANLAAQIGLDLLVLTAVVHFVGSLETYAAFAYLFHIVLACIFFSRWRSFQVTALGCMLYLACVLLEETHVLPPAGIYADAALRDHIRNLPGVSLLNVAWILVTWMVVWYLASHLSDMVRKRDSELAETNLRLIETQAEKTRHMLRTTHELKAPMAAIDANCQILLGGHCGTLPDEAREVVERVSVRSRRLAGEIQEMLQLANLRAASTQTLPGTLIDLAVVLHGCVQQIGSLAQERNVRIDEELETARTVAVEEHVKVMFGNLFSNAVQYSHEGGEVRVSCRLASQDRPEVVIEDHGIGIPPESLPRIFDEYYHTDEALRHNRQSTGLGLTIVRQVAESHGIHIRVESRLAEGTRFILLFPAAGRSPEPGAS